MGNKKNKILLILASICLVGCIPMSCEQERGDDEKVPAVLEFVRKGEENQPEEFARRRGRILREVIDAFYTEVKPDGMELIGIGGGINHDNKKEKIIQLTLRTKRILTVGSARSIIVLYLNKFLDILNNKEGIEEYIDSFPFDSENLDITILATDCREIQFSQQVNIISAFSNKISYRFSGNPDYPSTTVHKETLEEARRIVAEQKNAE